MTDIKKRILIAEDEVAMSGALSSKLSKEGYEVDVAENGEVALGLLRKNRYDYLFLDIMMPKVDGFGVLHFINREKIEVPVAVLTNLGQEEDEKKVRELGARAYFVKADTAIVDLLSFLKENLK